MTLRQQPLPRSHYRLLKSVNIISYEITECGSAPCNPVLKGCSGTQLKPVIKNRVENTKWRHLDWAQNNLPRSGSNFCHQRRFRKFKGLPLQGPPMNKDPAQKCTCPPEVRAIPTQISAEEARSLLVCSGLTSATPPPCRRNSQTFRGGTLRSAPSSRVGFPSTLPALPK